MQYDRESSAPITDPAVRLAVCHDEMIGMYGAASPTGGRFNLAAPFRGAVYMEDFLADGRHLAVDTDVFDERIYSELDAMGIPQLPVEIRGAHVVVLGVREGLKPLRLEHMRGSRSTTTYISDTETFGQMGRMFGAYWHVTNRLPLISQSDVPQNHVAIGNFPDADGRYLYLMPPYVDSGEVEPIVEPDVALERFIASASYGLQTGDEVLRQQLLDAARRGFAEVTSEQA